MPKIRVTTVAVADWARFVSVVFIVGTLTVVGHRVVHLILNQVTGRLP